MTTNPYATWDEAIAAGRVTDDADGWPDRAMVPVVAELRRQGIVTLQSCAGHQGSDDGHLWTTQLLDVDTAAFSLVRHVTHPEERWEFWWKPADRHRALEALLAARVTTNPTPTPAGAQEAVSVLPEGISANETHAFLEALLDDEYGTQGWNDLGSLRRITRAVNAYFAAIVRKTGERAWNEGVEAHTTSVGPPTVTEMRARNPYATKEADRA